MGDHNPSRNCPWLEIREYARNILIGKTVETIAPYATLSDRRRQRERLRNLVLGTMEGRVEASDLRQFRPPLVDQANRNKIVWLMQRGEWDEFFELGEYLPTNQCW